MNEHEHQRFLVTRAVDLFTTLYGRDKPDYKTYRIILKNIKEYAKFINADITKLKYPVTVNEFNNEIEKHGKIVIYWED